MAAPSITYTFVAGTTARAAELNQNFTDIINAITDGTKDITVNDLTVNGDITYSGAVSGVGVFRNIVLGDFFNNLAAAGTGTFYVGLLGQAATSRTSVVAIGKTGYVSGIYAAVRYYYTTDAGSSVKLDIAIRKNGVAWLSFTQQELTIEKVYILSTAYTTQANAFAATDYFDYTVTLADYTRGGGTAVSTLTYVVTMEVDYS